MRRLLPVVCLMLLAFAPMGFSLDTPELPAVVAETVAPIVTPVVSSPSFLEQVWSYINSNAGVTALAGIIAWVLGRVYTWKPAWKLLVEKYGPILLAGVRYAEKAIPDTTENKALLRADAALKKVIELCAALGAVDQSMLKLALDFVQAEAEAKGNI
jgi:hypothetical protein